jgi:DNA-binding Lrp family transcriptional regulator
MQERTVRKREPHSRDEALIRLLRNNARESVSSLARQLGLSRTAVQERINRLQRDGVIQGFTVRLGAGHERSRITAIVSMVVDPKYVAQAIAGLERMPEIQVVWTVSGKSDLIAIAGAAGPAEIDRVLDDIGNLRGITRTESAIILSTKIDRR